MKRAARTNKRGKRSVVVLADQPWLDGLLPGPRKPERFRFSWPRPARAVLRKRKPVRPSMWAEQHRVVSMSSLPGPWRNEVTPYLVGIMDASFHPSVRKIIVCKAPQAGMTEAAINCLCYVVDRDPGPALCVFPDRDMSRENATDRIKPALEGSTVLRRYLTGSDDDLSASRLNLVHMPIYMAWAHSASKLANKPIRYLVLDEVDKYPETSGKKESSPINLAEARVTTYPDDHKIWMFSSPTTPAGQIWRALTAEAQVVFRYESRCPHCRGYHVMEFDNIRKPDGERDAEKIEASRLAVYVCPLCGAEWNDQQRNVAVLAGRWVAWEWRKNEATGELEWHPDPAGRTVIRYIEDERPAKIGFHVPSWLSRFVSLSKAMASFVRGLTDKIELRDFRNKHQAMPWRVELKHRKVETIKALRDDRPAGVVPGNGRVATLVAGVDTQDNGFYVSIWAIGWGMTRDMWLVRREFVTSFEALATVLWDSEYLDADGLQYGVELALQDMLGHRTAEVYDFCIEYEGLIMPAFGVRDMPQPYTFSQREFYPGTDKPIPGGLRAIKVNTKWYKDRLSVKLNVDPGAPGGVHLYHDADEDFCRQLISEARDEKGNWVQIGSRPNHYWDTMVLSAVAADFLGVQHRPRPTDQREEDATIEVVQAETSFMER